MPQAHLSHFTSLPRADLDHVLSGVADWELLRAARIFVTGGTGIFGGWMTRSFLHANARLGLAARMTLLVRDPERARALNPDLAADAAIDFQPGTLTDFVFPRETFTHCLHMATQSFEPRTPAHALLKVETNLAGTLRVLQFAAASGVQRLLYTSSGAVYGPQPPDVDAMSEAHPFACDPSNPGEAYAMEKRAGEFLCTQAGSAHGFAVSLVRCFAFAGPGLPFDSNYAVGNFIGDILAGRPIILQGDGRAVRSYLHFAEMSTWLWTLLLHGRHGQPVNVGAREDIDILGLAQLLRELAGSTVDIDVRGKPDGRPAPRYVPDVRRACDLYGLVPMLSLRETLARTLAFHLYPTSP